MREAVAGPEDGSEDLICPIPSVPQSAAVPVWAAIVPVPIRPLGPSLASRLEGPP